MMRTPSRLARVLLALTLKAETSRANEEREDGDVRYSTRAQTNQRRGDERRGERVWYGGVSDYGFTPPPGGLVYVMFFFFFFLFEWMRVRGSSTSTSSLQVIRVCI